MDICKKLFETRILSDVTFSVGEEQKIFKAHKNILSVRSPVFLAMFDGDFKESSKEDTMIQLPDSTPSAFKEFLKFLYLDKVYLNEENWAPLLYLADKYDLPRLKNMSIKYVKKNCLLKEACFFYSEARRHCVLNHVPYIKQMIQRSTKKAFDAPSFINIHSYELLGEIFSWDELECEEIDIFRAANCWASSKIPGEEKCGSDLRQIIGSALFAIRFPRIPTVNFEKEVIPSGILLDEEIVDIFCQRNNLKEGTDFPSHPRIKICPRLSSLHIQTRVTKCHSIKFQVDTKIQIHGYELYTLVGKEESRGKITIKSENCKEILGEKDIVLLNDSYCPKSLHYFDCPISVQPHTLYTAFFEFSSLIKKVREGRQGKSVVNAHGVQWTFINDPSSNVTNVEQGQIPAFYFSQLI